MKAAMLMAVLSLNACNLAEPAAAGPEAPDAGPQGAMCPMRGLYVLEFFWKSGGTNCPSADQDRVTFKDAAMQGRSADEICQTVSSAAGDKCEMEISCTVAGRQSLQIKVTGFFNGADPIYELFGTGQDLRQCGRADYRIWLHQM